MSDPVGESEAPTRSQHAMGLAQRTREVGDMEQSFLAHDRRQAGDITLDDLDLLVQPNTPCQLQSACNSRTDVPERENLVNEWLRATDQMKRKGLANELQKVALREVTYASCRLSRPVRWCSKPPKTAKSSQRCKRAAAGHELMGKLYPLRPHFQAHDSHAGNVAARSVEMSDKS